MPVQKALKAYKEEKLNCAQSVLRAFQESCKITEEQILEAKKLGCVVNRCVLYYANVKMEVQKDDECIRATRYFG